MTNYEEHKRLKSYSEKQGFLAQRSQRNQGAREEAEEKQATDRDIVVREIKGNKKTVEPNVDNGKRVLKHLRERAAIRLKENWKRTHGTSGTEKQEQEETENLNTEDWTTTEEGKNMSHRIM